MQSTLRSNAVIESAIALHKTELIDRRAIGWDLRPQREAATARRVARFHGDRLHGEPGNRPPIGVEMEYVQTQGQRRPVA